MTFLIVTMVILGRLVGHRRGRRGGGRHASSPRRCGAPRTASRSAAFQLTEAPGLTGVVLALIIVLILTLRPQGMLGRWEIDELLARALRARSARQRELLPNEDETGDRSMAMPEHGRETGEREMRTMLEVAVG